MMHFETEVVMALNTNATASRGAEVTIDASKHPDGSTLTVLYQSDWNEKELRNPPADRTVLAKHQADGRATVRIDLPPAGMVMLA